MSKGLRWTLYVLGLIGFLLIGLLIGSLVTGVFRLFPQPRVINSSAIVRQVQGLSELVTVKYVIEKVIILEDPKWYGESRVLLLAHGICKAGVNLKEFKEEHIEIQGKKVIVRLPMEQITDVYLDEQKTQVIERSTAITRQFDKDLEQNARRQAVEDIRRAARNNGILTDSRERAEMQIRQLFLLAGFEKVEFKSPYNSGE
ncbi:MAG: DUF4230 domain-containing protein [Verrucomicrobiota bacterium]|nr:DUF4230 domain-containing protein [Verrucomicrobiota bacterium]